MTYTISYLPTNTATICRKYFVSDTLAELPTTAPAMDGDLAYAKDTNAFYSFDGAAWNSAGGGVAWGAITGTLSDQTDLQNALNAKEATANKNAVSGYAGLNAASRVTKGVDATDDVIIDLATKGLVLKDTQGTPHYWRLGVTILGILTTTDLGTSKP